MVTILRNCSLRKVNFNRRYDLDAQNYIAAVESADGQSLETGVKDAINAFVVGCKSDGIWTAIKASCILAGARTLSGALVPLVGTAPTNNNFVSGDFDRILGLTGNAVNKYLDSNRAGDADAINNMHLAVYLSANRDTTFLGYIGASSGAKEVLGDAVGYRVRVNSTWVTRVGNGTSVPSIVSIARNNFSSFNWRGLGQSGTVVNTGDTAIASNVAVFARSALPTNPSAATIAFYSIGESLDLALLDTRVTTLIDGLAFAVNTGLSPIGYSTETIKYVNAGYAAGGTLA